MTQRSRHGWDARFLALHGHLVDRCGYDRGVANDGGVSTPPNPPTRCGARFAALLTRTRLFRTTVVAGDARRRRRHAPTTRSISTPLSRLGNSTILQSGNVRARTTRKLPAVAPANWLQPQRARALGPTRAHGRARFPGFSGPLTRAYARAPSPHRRRSAYVQTGIGHSERTRVSRDPGLLEASEVRRPRKKGQPSGLTCRTAAKERLNADCWGLIRGKTSGARTRAEAGPNE